MTSYQTVKHMEVMGRTPFYRTSNKLERVHLLVIELEHLIFGFERTNIEHQT